MNRNYFNIILALFILTFTACGNDDDDGTGGTGGTEAEAGDEAGTGGSEAVDAEVEGEDEAGTGGWKAVDAEVDGAEADPIAQCMEDCKELHPGLEGFEECDKCACENCLQEINDCNADPGCREITVCALEKECFAESCYLPENCQEVIDEVGLMSTSVELSITARQCLVDAGCSCPWIPDTDATVTVEGTVVVGMPISEAPRDERPPIEGAEVCVYENEDICTTTDKNGEYVLEGVPANTDLCLAFTKDGYSSSLRPIFAGEENMTVDQYLLSASVSENVRETVGAVGSKEYGTVNFGVIGFNTEGVDSPFAISSDAGEFILLEGVSFGLDPENGFGPFYVDADEHYDLSLEATSAAGWGSFFDVEPGEYTVTFSHPTMDCIVVDGTEIYKVAAGYTTEGLTVLCM